MAATVTAPHRHSDTSGDLGFTYVFTEGELLMALTERMSMLPFLALRGDLQGTGSDTLRITHADGFGFAEAFTAMAAEDTAITPTGFSTAFDTVTIARYGLGKSETYTAAVLGREPGVLLDNLKSKIPDSWVKTVNELVATSGAGITSTVGSVATAWDFDDELALVTSFNETEGYEGQRIISIRHAEQYTDLRDAYRAEPAFQFPEPTEQQQAARGSGYIGTSLNIDHYQSFDVTQSGGGHQGFAFVPGVFGWARANTMPIVPENPDRAIVLPQFGMIIEEKTEGGQTATRAFYANAYLGVGRISATVLPQFRIISIDD